MESYETRKGKIYTVRWWRVQLRGEDEYSLHHGFSEVNTAKDEENVTLCEFLTIIYSHGVKLISIVTGEALDLTTKEFLNRCIERRELLSVIV